MEKLIEDLNKTFDPKQLFFGIGKPQTVLVIVSNDDNHNTYKGVVVDFMKWLNTYGSFDIINSESDENLTTYNIVKPKPRTPKSNPELPTEVELILKICNGVNTTTSSDIYPSIVPAHRKCVELKTISDIEFYIYTKDNKIRLFLAKSLTMMPGAFIDFNIKKKD